MEGGTAVEEAIRRAARQGLLPPGARLLVAVSGGRDSVVPSVVSTGIIPRRL
ncbi:MAG: hypothetical protein IMW98_01200 [Firmicutes bacterium]|nr:hypothetical protein [Bacillota bacterium]